MTQRTPEGLFVWTADFSGSSSRMMAEIILSAMLMVFELEHFQIN